MTTRIRRHATTVLAAAFLLAGALAACTPQPAPQPSPTGFASEQEAFAAAEATYRAYVDAVNARRADENSSPDPTDFLIGDALDAELKSEAAFAEAGVSLIGDIGIASIAGTSTTRDSAKSEVCLDVSNTRVVDSTGNDVTDPSRPALLGLGITTIWTAKGALISETVAIELEC